MLNNDQIQAAVDRLVMAAHSPSQVILFGSYARGDADDLVQMWCISQHF